MSAPNRSLYRVGWRIHKVIWRLSGGRLGTQSVGMPVLELTTTGRKSGEPRSVLLPYVEYPDGWVVIGSNLGSDRHPAWWLNLQADAQGEVLTKGTKTRITATELHGEDRAVAWDRAVAMNPGYDEYPTFTDRPIPVVFLRRA